MPFCLSHLPGQHKRLCIALSTFFLPNLLAAGQTSLNEESTFSLSLSYLGRFQQQTDGHFNARERILSLSYPGWFQQQTDGHLNMREHIQHLTTVSLEDHLSPFTPFSKNQPDHWLNAKFRLNSFTTVFFFLQLTVQGFFHSGCHQSIVETYQYSRLHHLFSPFKYNKRQQNSTTSTAILYKW